MALTIKRANLKDIAKLGELNIGFVKYAFKAQGQLALNNNHILLIAKEKDRVVGYSYAIIESGKYPEIRAEHIESYLQKDYVGKKIEKRLVRELVKTLRSNGVEWIHLSSYSCNEKILILWKRPGFKHYMIEDAI